MNPYIKNLNRIEFVVTLACTGRCKHCSEGDHSGKGEYVEPEMAAKVVREVAEKYEITSVMTFGGEPLLYPETVYAVHAEAKRMNIPERSLITNGFFSKDSAKIKEVAEKLALCGVSGVLLSVDAFHQETIPLEPVKEFAKALLANDVWVRTQPAWVVNKEHENLYNKRTKEILREFAEMGLEENNGNDIIPTGNARKYLSEYYDMTKEYISPYEDDPKDVRSISVEPNGNVLDGNIYKADVLDILEKYEP